MRAKKALGQHFLINESLSASIAQQAIERSAGMPILEVGPGKGALTKYLVKSGVSFKAVDLDTDMIGHLRQQYPSHTDRFIHANFVKLNPASIFDQADKCLLLGNFPYNISSQILFHMLEQRDTFPAMIGMFQKEVAQRVLAPPGSKVYGVPSVLIQSYYTGKLLYKVSPGSFSPPPKVDSSVIWLERRSSDPDVNYSNLKRVVKAAFGVRRKMLRNSLKGMTADDELLQSELFSRRPEQLSVADFIELTNLITK